MRRTTRSSGLVVVATLFAVVAVTDAFTPLPALMVSRSSKASSSSSAFFVVGRSSLRHQKLEQTNVLAASKTSEEAQAASELPSLDPATTLQAAVTGNPPLLVTLDDGSKYSYSEAIQRTLGWVSAAIIFGGGLWATAGSQTGEEFFAGYLVEQSLSVDNLFVFLLLFEYFKVPLQYQDRVLNWGIYGAIVMRAVMIGVGAAALQQFHAILLVFAGILVYSSAKFFIGGDEEDEEDDPSQNSIVKFSRSLIHSTDHYDEDRFFTIADGVRKATPLFICMIAVEISDVVFAVDSIPAVFGVTEVSWFRDAVSFCLCVR